MGRLRVDLFPGTPFPEKELKDCILNGESPRERFLTLTFRSAEASGKEQGQIYLYSNSTLGTISIDYEIHKNGGRERFQADMNRLKDLLTETTSGYCVERFNVSFSSCCDNLIPDAIAMLSNTTFGLRDNILALFEFDGAADPTVATSIVDNWRVDSERKAICVLRLKDPSRHRQVVEAMFTKPNITWVEIFTLDSNLITSEALRLFSSILSSPASSVSRLSLGSVAASPESDRELASMLATNKSLTIINIGFNSGNWIGTKMSRVMKEVNCTLGEIQLRPQRGVGWETCQAEMQLYTELNTHGRRCMRSMTFAPQKIPELLERAGQAEHQNVGRYLYPLLRENPSQWTSYLAHRHHHHNE